MNVKRKIVHDKVAEDNVDMEGTLSDAIRELLDMQDKHWRKGEWTNLRFVWDWDWDFDDKRLQLIGSRPETDQELRKRAGQAKRKATITRRKRR